MALKRQNVVSNAGWIIGCKLIKAVLTLVITGIVSRYLGTSNYGLLGYAGSLVAFVAPVLKLGIDSVLVYEIVNKPEQEGETLGSAIVLNFLSAFLCIAGIVSFTCIANMGETDTIIVCAVYSVSLIFQAGEIVQYWYQAHLLSKYSTIIMLASYIVISALQILMVYLRLNVRWFALSYSTDYLIMAVLLLAVYKKAGSQKLSFSWKRAKELLKQGRYYIVSSLLVTIFAQTDIIMIKLMIGDEATGLYRAATNCAAMAGFVFAAIIDSMRPEIFESFNSDAEKFEKRMKQLYSIIIYFSLFVSALITACAPIIIKILYGKDFAGAVNVLRVVVWYTTFSYLGSIRNVWILANGKQKYLWIINLSGALLNIVINLILIPIIGIMGAAAASLITQFFTNVIIGFIIKPLRKNNYLMMRGCNPKYLIDMCRIFIVNLKNRRAKKAESVGADGNSVEECGMNEASEGGQTEEPADGTEPEEVEGGKEAEQPEEVTDGENSEENNIIGII